MSEVVIKSCADCKYFAAPNDREPCKYCFNNDLRADKLYWTPKKTKETPVTDDKNISMIKSIIDEAMEKRDRTVTVYISGESMHVSVTPLGEDEPRWIPKDGGYVCSTCGQWDHHPTRYCRLCGEALKIVSEEVKTDG